MIASLNILAVKEDLISAVVFIAFVIIMTIISTIQKSIQKQKEKQREEEAAAGRTGEAIRQRPSPVEAQQAHAAELERAVGEALGVRAELKPVVTAELPPQRQPVRRKIRKKRPQRREATSLQERPAPVSVRSPAPPRQIEQAPVVTVELNRLAELRKAIIYHEIFSQPKALRQDREMWEI